MGLFFFHSFIQFIIRYLTVPSVHRIICMRFYSIDDDDADLLGEDFRTGVPLDAKISIGEMTVNERIAAVRGAVDEKSKDVRLNFAFFC